MVLEVVRVDQNVLEVSGATEVQIFYEAIVDGMLERGW